MLNLTNIDKELIQHFTYRLFSESHLRHLERLNKDNNDTNFEAINIVIDIYKKLSE